MTRSDRRRNLDLLRACAIMLVLGYHLMKWSPVDPPWLDSLSQRGAYGVDLFFVLSGYLIGGLYWREERDTGRVGLWVFWQRRWWRTLPPYAVALGLSWLAVYLARGERFDWRYLVFLQNFEVRMPFFLVSWSLCIEEQFYFFAPLLLWLTARSKWLRSALLVAGLLVPLVGRLALASTAPQAPFGFYTTATHLHCEGLAAGVGLAWVRTYAQGLWKKLQGAATGMCLCAAAALALVSIAGPQIAYVLAPSACTVLFAMLVAALDDRPAVVPRALERPVRAIAVTSYSIYLVHPLMIHAGNLIKTRLDLIGDLLTLLAVWPCLIALGSWLFYLLVERSALALREVLAPKRPGPSTMPAGEPEPAL